MSRRYFDSASSPVSRAFPLIEPGAPGPFEIVNPQGRARALIVCDHASRRIPSAFTGLGLGPEQLDLHIAWDIGAREVACGLSKRLDAPAVLAGYSRLLVDCNRPLHDPTAMPALSGGHWIPGNQDLSEAHRVARAQSFYWPYHQAIAARIEQFRATDVVPAVIAIHSFTPTLGDRTRDWDAGVLWDNDPRMPQPLIRALRAADGLKIGDNEPYSGKHPSDFTIDYHAEANGLPHVSIEIRQDHLQRPAGVDIWVRRLGGVLEDILSDPGLYALWESSG